jgi:hypothetical protein
MEEHGNVVHGGNVNNFPKNTDGDHPRESINGNEYLHTLIENPYFPTTFPTPFQL